MHSVRVTKAGRAAVVSASGELDAFSAPDLEAAFDEAAGDLPLLADLAAVSFMDSTALGLVVRVVREHRERGGVIRVVLPRGRARRIFAITALDSALPVSRSRAEALAELYRER